MVDFASRQRPGPRSRALNFSYEKAGLVLDNQPIPWNADAVLVEAHFKAQEGRRYQKEDFGLRLSGGSDNVPAENLKQENAELFRVFFRLTVPPQNTSAEIYWRGHSLGQLQLSVLQADDFLLHFSLQLASTSVRLENETVQCQTTVTSQCHSIVLSALLSSATSLLPIVDLGLRTRMLGDKGEVYREEAVHLSHSQLKGRQALVAVVLPRPRKTGNWLFQWVLNDKVLAEQNLRTLTAAALYRSLRVSATRFVLQYADGKLILARELPKSLDDLERIGPCFWVASSLPGIAGWCDLVVRARPNQQQGRQANGLPKPTSPQADSPGRPSHGVIPHKVLITDGPTPVLAGTLDVASFRQIKLFELRCRNRLLGLLPVEAVPTSTFTSEGGFEPPEFFPWSHAAESQLQEKLSRLLGEH